MDVADADDIGAQIERAASLVRAASRVTVLTGAGISTDSGIPDFRGPNGLWTRDPDAEKTSDIRYYRSDPAIRRKAWAGRLRWVEAEPRPNAGHEALVALERQARLVALITQNVDGLHHRVGHDPARVLEVHGTIREVECLACGDRRPMAHAVERLQAGEQDPACLDCGGILKSATVSFGQHLDPEVLDRAFDAARGCEVFLAVGTSLAVRPIADAPAHALAAGASLVIVNAEPTPYDRRAAAVVRGSISDVLPHLVEPELGNT